MSAKVFTSRIHYWLRHIIYKNLQTMDSIKKKKKEDSQPRARYPAMWNQVGHKKHHYEQS